MPSLYDPITAGSLVAKNRVWMAPLTRTRGTRDFIPTPAMTDYYAQRASAGVIITEATYISLEGAGVNRVPGIWNDTQIDAWKNVTKTVHEKGGTIVMQIWHMGRMGHSSTSGIQCVAPSPIRLNEPHVHAMAGRVPPETPRELTKEDIQRIVNDFAQASKNAISAGFDGVEIHAANGYLIDLFLKPTTNKRTDEYGGSSENRVRFLGEILEAISAQIGSDRLGVRLSPNTNTKGAGFEDEETETADTREAARLFQKYNLAFVELRQPGPHGTFGVGNLPRQTKTIRAEYGGPLILNSDLTRETAEKIVATGEGDAVTFGRAYISNPDLVARFQHDWPLTPNEPKHWYINGAPEYDSVPKELGYSDWENYKG